MKTLFTPTEQRIIAYTILGYSRDEIAKSEFRSPLTIRRHFENIFRKLGVHSKAELTRWYVENILKVDLTSLKTRIGAVILTLFIIWIEIDFSLELRRPQRVRTETVSRVARGRNSRVRTRKIEFA